MKVTKFPKPLTKKYLRLAATYRRSAGRQEPMVDFSLEALLECYAHETHGKRYSIIFRKDTKTNGYIYGKWQRDISVISWREDILAGHACKAEFITPLNRWWVKPALASVIAPVFFPYDKKTYSENSTNADVIAELKKISNDVSIPKSPSRFYQRA